MNVVEASTTFVEEHPFVLENRCREQDTQLQAMQLHVEDLEDRVRRLRCSQNRRIEKI